MLVGLVVAGPAAGRDGFVYITPPPYRLAHRADAVVIGTVTAIEPRPQDVWFPSTHWAVRDGEQPATVVRVRVEGRLLGRPTPAEVRVPLLGPDAVVRVGDCRIFLLGPHTAGGLRSLVPHVWDGVSVDSDAGRQVRTACAVLNDPLGGLTAPSTADRYRAADVLVHRWTDCDWLFGSGPQPVFTRVPDEQMKLALRAVADWPDWSAPPAGSAPPANVLFRLGLCVWSDPRLRYPAAGWSWPDPPRPPFDQSECAETVAGWVRDAGEWEFDLSLFAAVVRQLYDAANRPVPPAPLPPDDDPLDRLMLAAQPLVGWAVVERVREWRAARYPQAAFRLWLAGAGERFVLHTTDGRRASVHGEWWHRPGTGLPPADVAGMMRPEGNR